MNTTWNPICLDGKWDLFLEENCRCRDIASDLHTVEALKNAGFLHITGTVPGNFELDMQKANLLPDDLFLGTEPLNLMDLENRHLWYALHFESDDDSDRDWFFRFEGIDTISEIYLNGNLIATTDNMLIPHEVAAKGLRKGANELVVHIIPVFVKAREGIADAGIVHHQDCTPEGVRIRKAPHMFGWDIMPRIVSAGIWRSVYLFKKPSDRIEDVYLATARATAELGTFHVYFRTQISRDSLKGYRIVVNGRCGDSTFSGELTRMWHTEQRILVDVPNPKRWWPKGMGDPNLYDVTVSLYYGDEVLDTYSLKAGIRMVEWEATPYIDENGEGEFLFKVNGEKMFVRGTNWVPVDAFHSQDEARLPKVLALLDESNCNMVRCWGGNVYESDTFYNFCDEHGIAVWQDFGMGCSHYPQDSEFQQVIEHEMTVISRRLRNHTAIFLWVGDNECDDMYVAWEPVRMDPNNNVLTRQVLPRVLQRTDPFRVYMPSSPYIPKEAFDKRMDRRVPEFHLWGPRVYFKADFYTKSVCKFASEIGYHGCPSPESIKKFITEPALWPWMDNAEWQVHATCMEIGKTQPVPDAPGVQYSYRTPLMANQITALFGGEQPDNLDDFALMSQVTQAEAKKFFIERFRLGKWDKSTGILWWNLIDGWPQFSDAVVDYYFTKKLAFSVIKRIQEPVCLMCREPKDGVLTLTCANDTLAAADLRYKVTDVTHKQTVAEGTVCAPANENLDVAAFPYRDGETTFYLIEWTMNGQTYKNHYLAGPAPVSFDVCLQGYRDSGLLELEGF